MIKTLSQFKESNLKWTEFFNPMDEIDEDAWNYLMEIVAPHFCCVGHKGGWWGQNGECYIRIDGKPFYMTVWESVEGKYYYMGVLPEFKD